MPTPPVYKRKSNARPPCAISQHPVPLALLRIQHRASWRCLRTALAFPDFAHLARRLHLSHAELRAHLRLLDKLLGPHQLWLANDQIHLTDALRCDALALLCQPEPCPNALPGRKANTSQVAHELKP